MGKKRKDGRYKKKKRREVKRRVQQKRDVYGTLCEKLRREDEN